MTTNLRYEDRLDGAFNYVQWKYIMKNAFQESKVWGIVENKAIVPTDAKDKDLHQTLEVRAQKDPSRWSEGSSRYQTLVRSKQLMKCGHI
jgi:hypothetical protein